MTSPSKYQNWADNFGCWDLAHAILVAADDLYDEYFQYKSISDSEMENSALNQIRDESISIAKLAAILAGRCNNLINSRKRGTKNDS